MAWLVRLFRWLLLKIPGVQRKHELRRRLENEIDELRLKCANLESELRGRNAQLAAVIEEAGAEAERLRSRSSQFEQELERERRLLWARPGSSHSPIVAPDSREATRRCQAWSDGIEAVRLRDLNVRVDQEAMLDLFDRLRRHYPLLPFPEFSTPGRRYYYENPFFSYADAITMFGIVCEFRPRHLIEAGGDFSSLAFMDTIDARFEGAVDAVYFDTRRKGLLAALDPDDPCRTRVHSASVEEMPTELFRALEANDILSLHTTHVGKTGSDVLDCLFRILPALSPGVIVHLHDVFHPFEYPGAWIMEGRSWNELYFLRAFLQHNDRFEILYFNDWIYRKHVGMTGQYMPLCARDTGSSLWLRTRQ
ncbi:MAG: hypothetical protein ACK5AZ_04020 [Bryobacteraceae bacterium]